MFVKFEHYQGFIFDMDGTLLDSMPIHLDAWELTAQKYGFPFTRHWMNALGGMPSYKIVGELNRQFDLDLDARELSQFKMATFDQMSNDVAIIECTNQVLQHFSGKKPMAIGTGSRHELADRLLKQSGLWPQIDVLVSSDDVEAHKPHPDTFIKAAHAMQVEPSQCVVFEDTELGKKAAHSAQMDCYMVEEGELVFYPYSEK
ncbi:beta-phosphoglucomutase family hydrolase [Vibrio renipiscarius]|uniref:Carotenoid dehydrogenase n=1 Tax=Vibrio renipiscarius TaxID=1461322 RepID=A0A0C2NSD9_9VIBR|nr:beta-phosphoglucomutase family hydrolase [Vibrio renipiscarius]KII75991.1 carotenoid dehydrogenase [Vibrio renipiscarius]KII79095.1 carotenoid dehydrogenase [Vibrio renipiscarius]